MSQISPGEWHKEVPRDYFENLAFRLNLLELCRHDREAQQAVWYACSQDFLFFVNVFIYQYNPLVKGEKSVGPFIMWDFQDQVFFREPPVGKGIFWCYEHDKTCVVEKSRDMGASWLFLIFQVWLCIFHSHVQSFNISRSEKAVDSARVRYSQTGERLTNAPMRSADSDGLPWMMLIPLIACIGARPSSAPVSTMASTSAGRFFSA